MQGGVTVTHLAACLLTAFRNSAPMPLPHNTALSLLGYSRPGDAVQSKPKQAMIIRMSTETLDALESFPNHPQMEFELGANPVRLSRRSYLSCLKQTSASTSGTHLFLCVTHKKRHSMNFTCEHPLSQRRRLP